jgi:hypothetical protein
MINTCLTNKNYSQYITGGTSQKYEINIPAPTGVVLFPIISLIKGDTYNDVIITGDCSRYQVDNFTITGSTRNDGSYNLNGVSYDAQISNIYTSDSLLDYDAVDGSVMFNNIIEPYITINHNLDVFNPQIEVYFQSYLQFNDNYYHIDYSTNIQVTILDNNSIQLQTNNLQNDASIFVRIIK